MFWNSGIDLLHWHVCCTFLPTRDLLSPSRRITLIWSSDLSAVPLRTSLSHRRRLSDLTGLRWRILQRPAMCFRLLFAYRILPSWAGALLLSASAASRARPTASVCIAVPILCRQSAECGTLATPSVAMDVHPLQPSVAPYRSMSARVTYRARDPGTSSAR